MTEQLPLSINHLNSYPFQLMTLFNWNSRNHQLLKKLLQSTKTDGMKSLSLSLIENLAIKILKNSPLSKDTVVCFCPSKKGEKDHAYYLARKISNQLGLPLQSFLAWRGTQPVQQKIVERKSRFLRKMEWISGDKPRSVIFVDDVVTTGATVEAARQALDNPSYFTVASLAERALEANSTLALRKRS